MTATRGRVDPDALADLEEERDFLLRSLDDLERERAAGDIDEADYEALRDDYTARAAGVLRAIEQGRTRLPVRRQADPRRLVGVVLAVALLAGGAGALVAAMSGTRRPGDTITGGVGDTVEDRLAEAVQLANEGRLSDALRIYDEVVADDPREVRALMDRGLLLLQAGSAAGSDTLLTRGTDVDRAGPDGRPREPRGPLLPGAGRQPPGGPADSGGVPPGGAGQRPPAGPAGPDRGHAGQGHGARERTTHDPALTVQSGGGT